MIETSVKPSMTELYLQDFDGSRLSGVVQGGGQMMRYKSSLEVTVVDQD